MHISGAIVDNVFVLLNSKEGFGEGYVNVITLIVKEDQVISFPIPYWIFIESFIPYEIRYNKYQAKSFLFKETMVKKNYVLEEESAHVRMENLGANVTRTGQEKIALAVWEKISASLHTQIQYVHLGLLTPTRREMNMKPKAGDVNVTAALVQW